MSEKSSSPSNFTIDIQAENLTQIIAVTFAELGVNPPLHRDDPAQGPLLRGEKIPGGRISGRLVDREERDRGL